MEARALSTVAFVASLMMAAPSIAADKALDRSFDVPSGGRLNVDLDGGHITVMGSDSPRVVVRLRAEGDAKELERLSWSAEKDAAGVVVTSKRSGDRGWFNWSENVRVNASIEVPRNYNVDLNTSGGPIEVRNLNGNATGKTSGGRLLIEAVRGNVDMRTSGGPITVKSITGQVDVRTSGGPIQASEVTGSLKAHTSGGSIRVEQVSGPMDVHTSGGSIDLDLAGENHGIVARTSGGGISLRMPSSINASLDASTSGGRVKSNLAMTTSESSDSSLRGTINGGGPEIKARSSGGGIQIMRKD
jgi:DUF4097 and DUF4098 domain-containing protein YvlB